MLISTQNRPAISNYSAPARPKAETKSDYTFLAPGDAYVPSQPNAISVAASGSVLGALAGGGIAALLDGFGGVGVAVGLVVAGGIAGGYGATKAFEASQN